MEQPAQVPAALAVLDLVRSGRFAELRDMFAPQLRAMVTTEVLQAGWDAGMAKHGGLVSAGPPVSEQAGPAAVRVKIPLTCERGELALIVSVTASGWLTGIHLGPASEAAPAQPWQPPSYVKPEEFAEEDVKVGAGAYRVPGTLSLPHRPGPLPGVVLLAGSGPQDRDETIGVNKPLKDLAWGLASRGVAVLRFDKVTYARREEVRDQADFTVADEYLPQAVAAIQLLRRHSAVDPARVFVAGHSLGGTVAPRVAAAESSVAGLIILAGGAQPMHWAMVRQLRYIAGLTPDTAAAAQAALEVVTRQAELVDSPELTAATPASELPFGVAAPYWLDLRGYDPVAVAAELGKPLLLLQGARDYQVTLADDLARWQAGLDGRPDVTIRVHEVANHLFAAGSGQPAPAEYHLPQHMDPAVITDIVDWLATVS